MIVLKFLARMHYTTPVVAELWKSIASQIQDGGQPHIFSL